MPRIYLSPSTQENNMYVTGGSEEYYMNLVADAMVRYLQANAIQFTRNSRTGTAGDAIRESNRGNYDLHLALHSNAAPEGQYGTYTGIDVYYSPISVNGRRAADIFVRNLKDIYPNPEKVRAVPTTTIGEVTQTRAPAVFLELGYHDNTSDANWVTNNINTIARNLVLSLTQYFGVPFAEPVVPRTGTVNVTSGNLNLREKPSTTSRILASMPRGATLTVVGELPEWYVVNYRGQVGYALRRFISF